MGVIHSPESEYVKEREAWEMRNRFPGGYDPRNHPFPKMLYMAKQRPDGKISVGESAALDHIFGRPGGAEQFSATCQRLVKSEGEYRQAQEEGWRDTHAEAMAYHEKLHKFVSDAAAHRLHEDRNMSEAAKAEAAAADAESFDHVPEIPEKRGVGRPRKQSAA